jgi:hypothetical protein
MSRGCALVLLCFLASAAAPGSGHAAGDRTHTAAIEGSTLVSRAHRYSIDLAGDDWTLHGIATSPIQNPEADAELTSRSGACALVVVEETSLACGAVARLGLERIKRTAQGFRLVQRAHQPAGGLTGIAVTVEATIDDVPLIYRNLYVVTGTHAYQLVCWVDSQRFGLVEKRLDALLASFRVVPQVLAPAPAPAPGVRACASASPNGRSLSCAALAIGLTLPSDQWSVTAPDAADGAGAGEAGVHLETRGGGFCAIDGLDDALAPEEAAARVVGDLRHSVSGFVEIERARRTIAGLDAVEVRAVSVEEDETVTFLFTFLRGKAGSYQFACWASERLFRTQVVEFRSLVESLREQAD